ncbi:MAG: TolB family protein [Rubellimicrobium sp.]|nr:TolB family protein [Rubellimicrobium sp.]
MTVSELCIYDLEAADVRIVLQHEGVIEAPNWHPAGYLVVNGGGHLFRVALDDPGLVPLDTGFATACNNDHGLSPDGRLLVLSDKTETGQSCVYALPVEGGAPRRVTDKVPSWWHGWSPDGAWIVYAAARDDGPVAIYACPAAGGAEVCLTDAFDHADGPDYSADGQWIWFNGEREGAVDLWRIRPDGTDLERMTADASVNWFPHPSPCGCHVVYLAYPAGTAGHPGGLEVVLRLMPQGGGPARDLVRLHGGQGTINVPSWAPDGRAFAFMRYRD